MSCLCQVVSADEVDRKRVRQPGTGNLSRISAEAACTCEQAGRAAEAAGLQGRFWEMHDMLYENRTAWSEAVDVRPIFEDYARQLGLDLEQFKRDKSSNVVETRINQDHRRGRSMRVKGTPALYLNGVEIPYAQMRTIDDLRRVVNKALNL